MSYNPFSYVDSVGLGYLVNHVVSAKFAIDIALLLSYCAILNHPVKGSIPVTAFIFKLNFFDFNIMA